MRRKPTVAGKLFYISLLDLGWYEWVDVKILLRIILYPLCVVFAVWCWNGFRDGYEKMQLDRYNIEQEETQVVLDPGEDPVSDNGFELEKVNRMLTNSASGRTEQNHSKTNAPKRGKTNQTEVVSSDGEKGGMMTYFSGMLAVLIVFALLVARDVSHLAGERVAGGYVTKSTKSRKADMYEEAEAIWADGAYIDAIDSFRDYLKVFPDEYHVHKRIAEIYEKDLLSFRAAAMEYEEMLEMDIPKTRWGWVAIHLCNLYSGKLEDSGRALALLQRVADECGDTPPALKARERLAKIAEA